MASADPKPRCAACVEREHFCCAGNGCGCRCNAPLQPQETMPSYSPALKSTVRANAEKDTNYRPYCGPCPGLVRMQKVEPFYWRCTRCKAEHDERDHEGAAGRARDAAACVNEADRIAVLTRGLGASDA